MLKKLLSLPVRVAQKIAATLMGRNTTVADAPPPPPPPRRKPAPARPAAPAGGGHDHGHDHGGGHDHGHDHGGAREEAPSHDHGHDHGGGHDHGHDHGAPRAATPEPAAPAAPAPAPAAAEPVEKKAKASKKSIEVTPEDTPNPNARKFSCSVRVVEKGSLSFSSAEEAEKHPLGAAVWAVGGVKGVFAVNDFVTITKADDADWAKLTPKLVKALKGAL